MSERYEVRYEEHYKSKNRTLPIFVLCSLQLIYLGESDNWISLTTKKNWVSLKQNFTNKEEHTTKNVLKIFLNESQPLYIRNLMSNFERLFGLATLNLSLNGKYYGYPIDEELFSQYYAQV